MERIIRNTYLTNSNLSVSLIVRIFDKVYALFKGVRKLYQNRYLHTFHEYRVNTKYLLFFYADF